MIIGKQFKIARRLGERVFSKTQGPKFTASGTERRKSKRGKSSMSEFGLQLIEKQKARFTYVVSEKQFANYVKSARAKKGGNPANEVYSALESRLDNVVYRLGFAKTRPLARQMVSHGHILLNGRRNTIPSTKIKINDVIAIRPQSKDKSLFANVDEQITNNTLVPWLALEAGNRAGKVLALPILKPEDVRINFNSIIEFYSRV